MAFPYTFNRTRAFEYMARQKLPLLIQKHLRNKADTLNEKTHWESWLDEPALSRCF